MTYTLPILFVALPYVFLMPGLIWKSQLLFFLICPVFIAAFYIKNLWVRFFMLYLTAWQFLVFMVAFNNKRIDPGPGLEAVMAVMAGGIIYKYISEGKVPTETWFKFIRAAVILQIVIAIPQIFGYNFFMMFLSLFTPVQEKLPGHLVGTLGNRNYLAAFIAYSIPCFIGWRTLKVKGITINPALIGIFTFLGFCLSPGTLAAILGMTFYLSYDYPFLKRMLAWSVGVKICAVYTLLYVLSTGYHLNEFRDLPAQLMQFLRTGRFTLDPFLGDVGRFAMWMAAISQLMQSWVFMIMGFGPGAAWGRSYPIHSQYISVWFQYGLIALALMGGYIFSTARFLYRKRNVPLLTAFVIIGLDMVANFPGQIATTAFMIIVFLGLIERERLNG